MVDRLDRPGLLAQDLCQCDLHGRDGIDLDRFRDSGPDQFPRCWFFPAGPRSADDSFYSPAGHGPDHYRVSARNPV